MSDDRNEVRNNSDCIDELEEKIRELEQRIVQLESLVVI